MPDELWNEVRDIVQETGIKIIPMEKKCKKAKWLSGEALQITVKRREARSKGEKERYKHLNAEFQRIARRDKKAFFSDQCKETEENNRMGKTRDLFKKIRDTSVSLLLSRTQGYCYHLSKFHIYALVYCIGVFLYWCFSFWLTSLCIIGSNFIHLIRTDSNVFFLMAE